MTQPNRATTLTLSVAAPSAAVYAYAANPANLPDWAPAFCRSAQQDAAGQWWLETPMGRLAATFAAANPFGVLDHHLVFPDGSSVDVAMRVIANDAGAELLFTLIRPADQTDAEHAEDCRLVMADLNMLKRHVEAARARQTR
jgi:hypothetical protein